MVVVVTLLIWSGVHNARQRRLAMQEEAASKVVLVPQAKGGEVEAGDDGAMPKLEGKPAPGFTLVNLEGKKVSLADFKGKPVMVNFWATWCGPCKLEMPWLEEFNKKYAGQGLVILGVASDQAGKSVIEGVVKKTGVTYPVLLTDGKVEDLYGGVGFMPESFYVDKTGKIFLETAGISGEANGKDQIEANLKKLIAVGGA